MQLKRDTDYAIRMLYCIGQEYFDEDKTLWGTTITNLSRQSGVPKEIVRRICKRLEKAGFIECVSTEKKELAYIPTEGYQNQTLFNVIEAVEDTGQLFAVFGKNYQPYKTYGPKLETAQKKIEKILQGTKLGTLFEIN